jgi:acyl-CoA reductase-like NAD-dependent aldehyde dehydrogenase
MLRPLHLELGGNGAAIVLPDAKDDATYLDHVVAEVVAGRLLMNGQACAATKRVLAVGDTAGPLGERLTAALGDVTVGHPCDPASRVGPLIDAAAAARVATQVGRAVADGGRLALGSGVADRAWFEPTVLADVPPAAAVAVDDEIFGPVVTVVPVPDAASAVAVANATSLRLTASVFGTDIRAAMAVAEQLDFGGVVVGGTNNYRPPVVPFGGVALAGAGREGIGYTFEELTRSRFIALRNFRPAPAVVTEAGDG